MDIGSINLESLLTGLSVISAGISAVCAWKSHEKSAYQAYDSAYGIVLNELSILSKTTSLYPASECANICSIEMGLQPAEIFRNVWPDVKNLANYVREYIEADSAHKEDKINLLLERKRLIDQKLELFQPWAFALHQCHMIVNENRHLRDNPIFDKRLKMAQTAEMKEMFAVLIVRIEGECGRNHVDEKDFDWINDFVGDNENLRGTIREAIYRVVTSSARVSSVESIRQLVLNQD